CIVGYSSLPFFSRSYLQAKAEATSEPSAVSAASSSPVCSSLRFNFPDCNSLICSGAEADAVEVARILALAAIEEAAMVATVTDMADTMAVTAETTVVSDTVAASPATVAAMPLRGRTEATVDTLCHMANETRLC
ncbi:hypothetical protein PENTCL1PPCAC_12131, partial [Pristionchus entomophagus]